MITPMTCGRIIAQHKDKSGLSDAAFAARLGIGPKELRDYMADRRTISRTFAKVLEAVTRVPQSSWLAYQSRASRVAASALEQSSLLKDR